MDRSADQQIIVSGLGGQGVLLVSRVLAESAILKGFPVLTSEDHGMAQRGGTVVSHIKAGRISSPLIRPEQACGMIVLAPENLPLHYHFVGLGGWMAVNGTASGENYPDRNLFVVDADALCRKIGQPRALNLVMLGFVLGKSDRNEFSPSFFCRITDVCAAVRERLPEKLSASAIFALECGYEAAMGGSP